MYPDDDALGTFPQWLHQRFGQYQGSGSAWEDLTDEDWKYWEHEARAVLRAGKRGGFKVPPMIHQ